MEKNIKFEQNTPLWDNSLSIEERLDYLTGAMTLEEKIHCLTTGCPDIPRLGIRATYMGGEAAGLRRDMTRHLIKGSRSRPQLSLSRSV